MMASISQPSQDSPLSPWGCHHAQPLATGTEGHSQDHSPHPPSPGSHPEASWPFEPYAPLSETSQPTQEGRGRGRVMGWGLS